MRTELEEISELESYLRHNLNEAQQQDIDIRLLWDQEYEKRLLAQQAAYEAIRLAGRQQLRQELCTIYARLFS